jgi:transposase
MQTRRAKLGYGMMLLPAMESFIPEDHPLRKLDGVLDLSFIHAAVRGRYCQDNGRPSVDPEVVIRLFLIQAIDGIRSVRELMRQVQVNLAYRWFIGYELTEELPDHSTLSRALDRFGDAVFDQLFRRSIAQCRASGLIEGKVLHLDATVIRADIQKDQTGRPGCSDPDARFGWVPGVPGYKQQTVADGKARVVVDVSVMSADHHEHEGAIDAVDRATTNVGRVPEAVCADAAYASGRNRAALDERGVRLVSPPPKVSARAGRDHFTTEDFAYDEARDEFTCPAGATLRCVGPAKDRPRQRQYRALRTVCRACPLKPQCTIATQRTLKVSAHHGALIRLRADSQTESFWQLYRTRAPVIEGIFGEGKQWHGLRRAWRRGLSNMLIQSLLVAAVMNFKRLMAASAPFLPLYRAVFVLVTAVLRMMRAVQDIARRLTSNAPGPAPTH